MINPKKSLGQNFLVDKNIIKKIINTTNISNENIIEIGPGLGALTNEIIKLKPKKLILIEKDFYKLVLSKIFVYVCLIGIPIAFIGALFSFANGVSIGSFAKVFLLLSLSNLLLFNLFAFGNALSINKGAMLGVLSSLPLALPVIILLGRAIRSIQYDDSFFTIITLMVGIGLIMSAIMPLIISAALKTHID